MGSTVWNEHRSSLWSLGVWALGVWALGVWALGRRGLGRRGLGHDVEERGENPAAPSPTATTGARSPRWRSRRETGRRVGRLLLAGRDRDELSVDRGTPRRRRDRETLILQADLPGLHPPRCRPRCRPGCRPGRRLGAHGPCPPGARPARRYLILPGSTSSRQEVSSRVITEREVVPVVVEVEVAVPRLAPA